MCEYDRAASNLVRVLFQRIDQFLFGEAQRSPPAAASASYAASSGAGSLAGSTSSTSGRPTARPARTPLRSLSTFHSQNAPTASRCVFVDFVVWTIL